MGNHKQKGNDMWKNIMKIRYLDERLEEYSKSDYYGFHMPGHKRQLGDGLNPYEIDITEIEGFDNLHDADDILKDAQKRAADLYGAKSSYFLINGSTCGILTAISAAVQKRGKILIARNCHRAVYHAAYLRELSVKYVYPVIDEIGIQGHIIPEDIRRALQEDADIRAVVITSPTYDGVVSDIKEIAQIVHSYGIPLIVDEAHGAHFGFHPYFPQTAVRLGADLVIQSMHKTLPSLTQTALLHVCSSFVDEAGIKRFLGIYETSSPSYILMASMDKCIRMISEKKEEIFEEYGKILTDVRNQADVMLRNIDILDLGAYGYDYDSSKLLITAEKLGLNGKQLYDILFHDYHLQMEMCSGNYVLAMTSYVDKMQAYGRLLDALADIERRYGVTTQDSDEKIKGEINDFMERVYCRNVTEIELAKAWDMECEVVLLEESAGRVAGDFLNLYPPGIPLLVPGEVIGEQMICNLKECMKMGLNIKGIYENHKIKVCR